MSRKMPQSFPRTNSATPDAESAEKAMRRKIRNCQALIRIAEELPMTPNA